MMLLHPMLHALTYHTNYYAQVVLRRNSNLKLRRIIRMHVWFHCTLQWHLMPLIYSISYNSNVKRGNDNNNSKLIVLNFF